MHDHSRESVVISGMIIDKIGTLGLYLATSFAVVPPLVRTKIKEALMDSAVLTTEEAKLYNGLIGIGALSIILLKRSP